MKSDGTMAVTYEYDAWGNIVSTSRNGSDAYGLYTLNVYTYRGYIYDIDTGFYYLQSRYYDPEVGRFLNADDTNYLGATGTTLGYNLYAYCENNGVNNSDYLGYLTLSATWFGFALDIAFTAVSAWIKVGYDIIGAGLKVYAQKKGFKLFYDKLLTDVVPKIKGVCGKQLTYLRTAIWRFAGNVSGNMTTGFLGTALSKFLSGFYRLFNESGAAKVMQIVCRCLTLGSLIDLVLDWYTDDDPFNDKIVF